MTAETRRVLITVKAYPNPSQTYDEAVCTAGIDIDTGRFIRLFPVRFRHMDYDKWFAKYDILEMDVERHKSDPRKDTYTPVVDTIKCVGHIRTGSKRHPDWVERSKYVLPLVTTIEELADAAGTKECSLGVVPMRDVRFTAEADAPDWTAEQLAILNREQLFGRRLTPLEKIPWKFHYTFKCSDGCKGHNILWCVRSRSPAGARGFAVMWRRSHVSCARSIWNARAGAWSAPAWGTVWTRRWPGSRRLRSRWTAR